MTHTKNYTSQSILSQGDNRVPQLLQLCALGIESGQNLHAYPGYAEIKAKLADALLDCGEMHLADNPGADPRFLGATLASLTLGYAEACLSALPKLGIQIALEAVKVNLAKGAVN